MVPGIKWQVIFGLCCTAQDYVQDVACNGTVNLTEPDNKMDDYYTRFPFPNSKNF